MPPVAGVVDWPVYDPFLLCLMGGASNLGCVMITPVESGQYETRVRGGIEYRFDPATGLFLNEESGKWVQNPIRRKEVCSSTRRRYSHPLVDPLIQHITKDECLTQSIQCVLKMIAIRQQIRKRREAKQREHGGPVEHDDYCWMNWQAYSSILGGPTYKGIMDRIVAAGILEADSFTSTKGRHPVYRFAHDSFLSGYSLPPVTFARLDRKLEAHRLWLLNEHPPVHKAVIEQVIENFPHIDLNEQDVKRLWGNRYDTKYLPRHPTNPRSFIDYMEDWEQVWNLIKYWNDADDSDKADTFTTCSFGRRLHNIFTYLPSEVRAYVLDRQRMPVTMIEFDLANSQPALFANLLVTEHRVNRRDRFVELVEQQGIYKDLAQKLNISEKLAKTEMFHYLYCMACTKAQEQFEAFYGLPAQFARMYKERTVDDDGNWIAFDKRHAELPKAMQRMETEMFRRVWSKLLAEGYKFIPVHDAVYVAGLETWNEKRHVEKVIKEELGKMLEIKFEVRNEVVKRMVMDS